MDPREWDHVIHVNLSGAFYASRAVLQHMLDRGYGRIINISSIIGSAGGFGQANYAAAKSGMFGLTMSLALETASKGITVNTVTPGFISTDMTAAVPADALAKVVARIPVRRLGQPDEVARVVEFLADPESGYITGQVYPVNGGSCTCRDRGPRTVQPEKLAERAQQSRRAMSVSRWTGGQGQGRTADLPLLAGKLQVPTLLASEGYSADHP